MKAILIHAQNREKMLAASPIAPAEIDRMIMEYGQHDLYFVPQSDIAHSLDAGSWMTIPRAYLEQNFRFDDDHIGTDFVEITRK